ncbi:hypothetical protein [Lyticum sinuosum]|uniref:Uncharacterized protein n=1 Tax=Lyticum sinuosum TaxID=1332059 RepID=A0AAE5AHH4_9RICK|nr:hypothetical protein [Lyticum sinuosum]MDZ5761118.1 hypothetical protein [Lyticum sinuosum]
MIENYSIQISDDDLKIFSYLNAKYEKLTNIKNPFGIYEYMFEKIEPSILKINKDYLILDNIYNDKETNRNEIFDRLKYDIFFIKEILKRSKIIKSYRRENSIYGQDSIDNYSSTEAVPELKLEDIKVLCNNIIEGNISEDQESTINKIVQNTFTFIEKQLYVLIIEDERKLILAKFEEQQRIQQISLRNQQINQNYQIQQISLRNQQIDPRATLPDIINQSLQNQQIDQNYQIQQISLRDQQIDPRATLPDIINQSLRNQQIDQNYQIQQISLQDQQIDQNYQIQQISLGDQQIDPRATLPDIINQSLRDQQIDLEIPQKKSILKTLLDVTISTWTIINKYLTKLVKNIIDKISNIIRNFSQNQDISF